MRLPTWQQQWLLWLLWLLFRCAAAAANMLCLSASSSRLLSVLALLSVLLLGVSIVAASTASVLGVHPNGARRLLLAATRERACAAMLVPHSLAGSVAAPRGRPRSILRAAVPLP